MKTFAENLRDEIEVLTMELPRLRAFFIANPTCSTSTCLSYQEAKDLGFEVSDTQRDGVMVSLPKKHTPPPTTEQRRRKIPSGWGSSDANYKE